MEDLLDSGAHDAAAHAGGHGWYRTDLCPHVYPVFCDISKKERKILHVITDILSEYITDKEELDKIIDRIDAEMKNGGK